MRSIVRSLTACAALLAAAFAAAPVTAAGYPDHPVKVIVPFAAGGPTDVKERCAQLGFDPVANTPQEFAAYVKKEVEKWRNVIREAKIPLIK